MRKKRTHELKSWLLMIICMLVVSVAVSAVVSKYVIDKVYISSSTLIMDKFSSAGDSDISRIAKICKAVATSNQVMEEIVTSLDLEYSMTDLQKKIKVFYDEDTGLMHISVKDNDAETAYRIAKTLVKVLKRRMEQLFVKSHLKVVDKPYIPSVPSRPDVKLNMMIAAVFSLLLSAFIIVLNGKYKGM
ncbi:MAG: hypothetical protein GX094_00490 [Clostridiales bacterium]|nr:hypothetical protein [Clostridiales bacterium]